MAGSRRHWKEKNGRFWARMAIPEALRPFLGGRTQLAEPLGGDRTIASQNHAAAVARLQQQISQARAQAGMAGTAGSPADAASCPPCVRAPLTPEIIQEIAHRHYRQVISDYDAKQECMPSLEDQQAEYDRIMQKIDTGEISDSEDPVGAIMAQTDYELMRGAREHDRRLRRLRMDALKVRLGSGDHTLVEISTNRAVEEHSLAAARGSKDRQMLSVALVRAEIAALTQTLERDAGNFEGQSGDPILQPPQRSVLAQTRISLQDLFQDYILSRQQLGKHRDGGANWNHTIADLRKFWGHDDAGRISKRNLLDWRDALLSSGKAPKTVSDKYLAAIRAVLKWAHDNDRLPSNEASSVQQQVPRKIQMREKGYSTLEATRILKAAYHYQPPHRTNPANQERPWLSDAKRWVPLLAAFSGARPTELTQLRKEDLRIEAGRWIMRITPEAGSVKTGQFRDVPLHPQLVSLGFADFVIKAGSGPLFHRAHSPEKYVSSARAISGEISEWLNRLRLVPDSVQPNYGFRHRFKTLGLEQGAPTRILNAIQGHPGTTASDGYGDVTITAMLRVIDAFAEYDLNVPVMSKD